LLEATFLFRPDFIGFSGHFPGNPVLPGIVQIMAAAYTAGFGAPLPLRQVKRCKFLRPVRPNEPLQVRMRTGTQAGTMRVQAVLRTVGEPCATMSLTFDGSGAPSSPIGLS
jgi:3-hydroxymyristoyl/3-hydroxydecanoyl-(acyl carrier protein) dehydratase